MYRDCVGHYDSLLHCLEHLQGPHRLVALLARAHQHADRLCEVTQGPPQGQAPCHQEGRITFAVSYGAAGNLVPHKSIDRKAPGPHVARWVARMFYEGGVICCLTWFCSAVSYEAAGEDFLGRTFGFFMFAAFVHQVPFQSIHICMPVFLYMVGTSRSKDSISMTVHLFISSRQIVRQIVMAPCP